MIKKGDTLIEVTIAVGIFSLVAVGIVAVMSSGTSGAQTSLETTLAREEIDAQAEALRFIQASYVAARARGDLDNRYVGLWQKITENAQGASEEISEFNPGTCQSLYEKNDDGNVLIASQRAFVIDTEKLSSDTENAYTSAYDKNNTNPLSDEFKQASTYPRLNYLESLDEETLKNKKTLESVEGIYVIAVKAGDNTGSSTNSGGAQTKTAYYDFYIRTCWYGTGDQNPSTISTVIRLSDPGKITTSTE